MSKLTIEVTPEQHKKIKMEAVKRGMTIRDYILKKSLGEEKKKRKLGQWTGKIWMSDDFNEFGEELQEMFGMLPEKPNKKRK